MDTSFIAKQTYDTTLASINLGLTLASALAWNEYFKSLITAMMTKGNGLKYMLVYALMMSILTTIFMIVTKKVNEKKTNKST